LNGTLQLETNPAASLLHSVLDNSMATRQLRRLKEQLQAQEQTADAPESEEALSEEEEQPGKAPFNPFDLLSDEEVCTSAAIACKPTASPFCVSMHVLPGLQTPRPSAHLLPLAQWPFLLPTPFVGGSTTGQ
jgi:hypothetical protein